jgi:hypothetical protein
MTTTAHVDQHFDSLMDIFFAQYSDLEALLALARREAVAAEQSDFERVLEIACERASLGDRLEVYHRQLAELRARLGEAYEPALATPVAARTASLVERIRLEDARTCNLLIAARDQASKDAFRVDQTRRNLGAYARNAKPVSVACDKHI